MACLFDPSSMASSMVFSSPSVRLPWFLQKASQFLIAQKTQIPFPCQSLSVSLKIRQGGVFVSPYNVGIVVEENEPEEKLVGRFRREVFRAGIIQECKRRRFFENKHDKIKRKSREAAKRNRKRRPQFKSAKDDKEMEMVANNNKQEDNMDDDNWDLPQHS